MKDKMFGNEKIFFDYSDGNEDGAFAARIKVIGTGGGGGNAVRTMQEQGITGVEFIICNTDAQALVASSVPMKLQLGKQRTKGLGAGGKPEIGKAAAMDDEEAIRANLKDSDMVFVTAGMGGGTGTGSAPVIASIAKELGALTVGVVTKPFSFEGRRRMKNADQGLAEFRKCVDTLIVIPNQQLLSFVPKNTPAPKAFAIADNVLCQAVKGISELITGTGVVNLDFADVQTVMSSQGLALMGVGVGEGEDRAIQAAMNAINSPLLEDSSIEGARGILINITGSHELTLHEIDEAANKIIESADEDAEVFFGAVFDDSMGDKVSITVIATGFISAIDAKKEEEFRKVEEQITPTRRDEIKSGVSNIQMVEPLPAPVVETKPERVHRPFLNVVNGDPTRFEEDLEIPAFLRRQAD